MYDAGAINYDPTKEVDDGSCTFVVPEFDAEDVVYGCTYAQATNYNPNATNDDGSVRSRLNRVLLNPI